VYAEALHKLDKKTTQDSETHEEKLRYSFDVIKTGRKALSRVAEISGFELETCNSDKGARLDRLKKVKETTWM